MTTTVSSPRFQKFIKSFSQLVEESEGNEELILAAGRRLLGDLVSNDDWLPDEFAQPHPEYYQQYLLHADPQDKYSVVSFVWGPGQKTPIHNHTVWALIGMMRGSERAELFEKSENGQPMRQLGSEVLLPGNVDMVSPRLGDIHRVSNCFNDRVSISVHVYGGNIGRIPRHVFDLHTGSTKSFISGYTNDPDKTVA